MIQLLGVLLPLITKIVHKLLESGYFPDSWKEAQALPLLESSHLEVQIDGIVVGNSEVFPSSSVRNLGVFFDSHMSMADYINKTSASAFYYPCNIRRIRKYISVEVIESLLHALVTSCIDHGNSLLFGLPDCQLNDF